MPAAAGEALNIGVVGASISAGQGVIEGAHNIYPFRLKDMMNSARRPGYGTVNVFNGAVAGTVSMFMSVCVKNHVPEDVDIVLVEYAVNDNPGLEFDHDQRKGFERLLRKLLNYPKKPAVVMINSFAWQACGGDYFGNAESAFLEYATYYGLPVVSLKAAVHELMVQGVTGFWVNTTRGQWANDRPEL
jgi:hypothetical protein